MKIRINRSCVVGNEKPIDVEINEPFATGIIDPDWPYTVAPGRNNIDDIEEGKGRHSGFTRNKDGRNKYRQQTALTIQELKDLPIKQIIGGYVFLWTVGPFLINGAATDVLKAWEFEPVSMLAWAKYHVNEQKNLFGAHDEHGYGGVGYWFLGNSEYCIVGKRKGLPSIRTGTSSLIVAPKRRHSEKPEHIHKLCESKLPGPYIELFGRKTREHWVVLGDEVPGYEGEDIRVSMQKYVAQ